MDKLGLHFNDLGEQALKNIKRPVQAFSIDLTSAAGETTLPLPDKPSIAVLPFENMSGDPEQEYFCDGISEDIITDLSHLAELVVIARNSSFNYRGKSVPVQQIGRELGVTHILEGSVRKSDQRLRITAQLVSTRDGHHLWADRYDRNLSDIFVLQDEITQRVISALKIKLLPSSRSLEAGYSTSVVEAYDWFLKGRHVLLSDPGPTGWDKAEGYFRRAIELDANFAGAYGGLSMLQSGRFASASGNQPGLLTSAKELAERALSLNESEPAARSALALVLALSGQHDEAIATIENCLADTPNHVGGHRIALYPYVMTGRLDDARAALDAYLQLDPLNIQEHAFFRGWLAAIGGRYLEAADEFRAAGTNARSFDLRMALMIAATALAGRTKEARTLVGQFQERFPSADPRNFQERFPLKDPNGWNWVLDGLRKAGLPE